MKEFREGNDAGFIIEREKFVEEISKSFGPDSERLKRINRIKHTIKINLHKDPDFYKPLSDRLEKLIKLYKEDRLKQLELFKNLDDIEEKIINKDTEGRRLGFATEGQFAVYNTLKIHLPEEAKSIAQTLFHTLTDELGIDGWQDKEQVQKTMRRKIKSTLGTKLPRTQKDSLAHGIVTILKHNRQDYP